jgi:hypothetical protein
MPILNRLGCRLQDLNVFIMCNFFKLLPIINILYVYNLYAGSAIHFILYEKKAITEINNGDAITFLFLNIYNRIIWYYSFT